MDSTMGVEYDDIHVMPPPWKRVLQIVVLREAILEFLSFHDLLTCSLVSKEWKDWCRTYIWNRKICCFCIPSTHPCISLKEFGDLVAKAIIPARPSRESCLLPFNGLKITFDSERHRNGSCISWPKVLKHTRSLTCHLQLKYIFVNIPPYRHNLSCIQCHGAKLVWKLIFRNTEILKEVELSQLMTLFPRILDPSAVGRLWQTRTDFFPSLKRLQYENDMEAAKLNVLDYGRALEALPKDTEIHSYDIGNDPVSLLTIPKTKWHAIRRFVLRLSTHSIIENCTFFLDLSPIRLHSLRTEIDDVYHLFDHHPVISCFVNLFWESLQQILTQSSDILQHWEVDMEVLLSSTFRRLQYPPFRKLQELTITKFWFLAERPGDAVVPSSPGLCCINWTSNFPVLHRVHIEIDSELLSSELFDSLEDFLRSNNHRCPHPCVSVRELSVIAMNPLTLRAFRPIFPNVKRLEVLNESDFDQFWTPWPHLEELILTESCGTKLERYDPSENGYADHQFCGVTEEEAKILRTHEPEVLENLYIVRTGPSVTDLKDLRKITFKFLTGDKRSNDEDYYMPWFITRLTGYLAFSRMPQLQVTFVLEEGDNQLPDEALLELPCVQVENGKYQDYDYWDELGKN